MQAQRRAALTALSEFVVMFLPGIPAYIWLWPRVSGVTGDLVEAAVALYFLAGCLVIGLRRWNLDQLGLNRRGIALSLICGSLLIVFMILGRFALNLPFAPPSMTVERIAFDIVYYFGVVGFVQELLFRGLLYRALDEWRGARFAIWGSAIAFGIFHVGGLGIIGGLGTAFIGLIFALIRWRAGGIVGLIFIHSLYDIIAVEGWGNLDPSQVTGNLQSIDRPFAFVCDVILLGLLLYLWKIHPRLMNRLNDAKKS